MSYPSALKNSYPALDCGCKVCKDASMRQDLTIVPSHGRYDRPDTGLTLDEKYYKYRRLIHFWIGFVLTVAVTVILGVSAETDGDAEALVAMIAGCLGIVEIFGGTCAAMESGFKGKRNENVLLGRGVRYRKEALRTIPIGNEVLVEHAVRTGPRPLLWPVFGTAPSTDTDSRKFNAESDADQEKARDFVVERRHQTVSAAATPEAKALAKALKA